ncbi:zinc-dependent metalloprotease [Hyphobacterium sp. HN65]|uniref:Zinc-dependent metalloprotease n=1 Tax=Hyphobacterium lacteum TaxID=3116575 RepID=A0ABU7LQP3_9PROT|nr:zinc-dependent metalloprotease [Hyphobacterium sp. HN65]MEE2526238.1 zinc-dependent metalloprotease [Hyphobacterium sp. HN65]
MKTLITALIAMSFAGLASAQDEPVSYADTIAGLELRDGFVPLYVDDSDGRILARLSEGADGDYGRMIYTARMTSGLGSNPVGIDRGLGSSSEVLRFTRVGNRIYAEFENTRYRADGAGADEANATRQSFARSIVWSTDIVAEDDGNVLIDLSAFLTRDQVDTAGYLSNAGEGTYSVDGDRSAPLPASAMAFPQNVEIDALITLSGSPEGGEVAAVTPDADSITLTVHHSFVALPEAGYQVREADERSAAIPVEVYDMAAPLDQPIRRQLALRHRLERVDPSAPSGPVVEPIVYYVDRGTPDIIRDALIEGGNWWAEAFAAAGFEEAFRVEVLPEGVHPLDVRYNVIQWVHRQTRGWSYGGSVYDPRTGEIIKGHVLLGSQRVRQDRMIFEGLLGRAGTGTGADDDPLELALDRVRQLSAHEIGHTIGLMHNFAASVSDRASVMDYPAPLVRVGEGGVMDVSAAYDVGIGEWDIASVRWLYSQFADPADEAAGLEAILDQARSDGLMYISDRHARGNDSGHPLANLWDNGANPTDELLATLDVREQALAAFGPHVMQEGWPLSSIRDAFPPIYLYHRYQVEAAASSLGGVMFAYENNHSGVAGVSAYDAAEQRRALAALIETLQPAQLDISDATLALLSPSPYVDYDPIAQREHFESDQYPAFSRTNAAAAAARNTLQAMLSPARLARMSDQAARDETQLSPSEVLNALHTAIIDVPRGESARLTAIRQAVQTEFVLQLLRVAASDTPSAAAPARAGLEDYAERWGRNRSNNHFFWLARQIEAGLARIDAGEDLEAIDTDIPPGSPIGADSCWHCDSGRLVGLGD